MLKQIIVGMREHPVKYHGQVKYTIFSCLYCGKNFEKPQSYVKKQMKTRSGACCFCSPPCRRRYLQTGAPKPAAASEDNHKKHSLFGFLTQRVFHD